MPQPFLDGLASDPLFDEREQILRLITHEYRFTAKDRAQIVGIAESAAGPDAPAASVNAALRKKIEAMLRPFSADDVLDTAVAISPTRNLAVLPLTERAFYAFVNHAFSPCVKGVFLWENFRAESPHLKYVSVHRFNELATRAWWSGACHNLIHRRRDRLVYRSDVWRSFGLMSASVTGLTQLFPANWHYEAIVMPDDMVRAIDSQNRAFQCAHSFSSPAVGESKQRRRRRAISTFRRCSPKAARGLKLAATG